jgi:hypothetical protein
MDSADARKGVCFISGLGDWEVPEYWSLVNTPDFSGKVKVKRKAILNGIKAKGGLYGRAAEMYMNDDEKADQFIKECAEQCHNRLAQEMWGEELVLSIREYSQNVFEKTLA